MNPRLLKKGTPFLFFLLALLSVTIENFGQRPNLGTAADFALFTRAGALGSTGISTVTGKVGTNAGAVTGFDPALNEVHNTDVASAQCSADVLIAYNQLRDKVPTIFPLSLLGNGQVLFPGIYSITEASTMNGSLTFDAQGNSNAIFIIQIQGAFSTTASSVVHLINGALAVNIFWKVEGAVAMTAGSIVKGTFIANNGAFSMGAGCELEGRGLSTTGAVSIYGSRVYIPVPLTPPAPPCPIVTGSFHGIGNGAIVNNSPTGWYLDASQIPAAGNFNVKANRFLAQELGGQGIWLSKVFSVAGNTNFKVAAKISAKGKNMTSSEYVKLYYKINGGAEILFGSRTGDFGSMNFTSPALTGDNVQLIIKLCNYDKKSQYFIDDYRVFKEIGPCVLSIPVTIVAANGGVLTHINPLSTLSASTTASGPTTYSWTGPEGFRSESFRLSSQDNLDASVEGVYNLYATNSAGSGSTCYTVTSNKTPPDLTATGATMTCASSVVIRASSSVSGVTYSWTGPNGFTSSLQNPTVTKIGTYTVTARNPANGATTSKTVTVTGPVSTTFWIEDFTFGNGTKTDAGSTPWTSTTNGTGTYSVQNNEFKTSFCNMAEGIWTSGVINIAGKSNVVISVNLRSETASGSNYFETDDYIRVYYKLNGGAQILAYEDLAGVGNSTSGTASFNLSSMTLNGSTLQVIIKTKNSELTERYYFDKVKLTSTPSSVPGAVTTSVTGVATCASTAQIFATATPGATAYSWTGPNGFTSTQQNPFVTAGGQYIVTATLTNGCTAIAPVTVTQNKTAPDITATGGILGCLVTTSVNANSSVAGATYTWTGPNGFTSTLKNPSVTVAGTYTATVKNPANGCTATAPAQVTGASVLWLENFSWPNFTASDAGTTSWAIQSMVPSSRFYVYNNEFKVSSVGTATGSQNVWSSGIINISGKSNISVSAMVHSVVTGSGAMSSSGVNMDYIRFYYKLNGGAEVMFGERISSINNHSSTLTTVSAGSLSGSSLQIIVRGRATGSDEYYYFDNVQVNGTGNVSATASSIGILNCAHPTVNLSGTSSVPGATYSWSGPGGFSSSAQNPSVNTGGIYTLTVTDPSSGCSGTDTANVVQQSTTPGAMASATSQLRCSVNQAVLSGSSSASGASYSWTGPGGFSSALQNPVVTVVGIYTLTVTTGECSSSDTVLVVRDTTGPGAVPIISSSNTELTCVSNNVRLDGTSSVSGASYSWTLPNGSIVSGQGIDAFDPGVYRLKITDPATGCSSSSVITINQNIVPPANLVVENNLPLLSCINPSVVINASSSTPDVSYNWSGPDGFVASTNSITTSVPGEYIVTVTDPVNGCTNSATTTVNKNPPVIINATPASGQITCIQNSVALDGSTSAGALTFAWTGPNDYSSSNANIMVTMPGDYMLVTTDANGCPDSSIFLVTQDKNEPVGVRAGNSGQISCYVSSVFVMGSSTTPGATFSWTGPDGFTASTPNAETELAGTYTLVVTNPINGCTATAVATVENNTNAPEGVTAINSGPLNCINPSVTLTGNSTSTGVDYTWVAPNEELISGAIVNVTTAGPYTLVVTDIDNGCVSVMPTTVLQNNNGCSKMSLDTSQTAPVQKPVTGTNPASAATAFEYRTYPNPFTEKAIIEFRSPEASLVTVELFNNNGMRVKLLFKGTVIANHLYTVVLKARSLNAGAYHCIIRSNGSVYSTKLLYMY